MAYGIVHKFPGGTKEQYEAALARVHPPDGLPEGQLVHIAGATEDGGWMVCVVHESKESWERFRDETLMPGLSELGDEGFPGPPEETAYEVDVLKQA
jgi:hypothetical protein